MTAVPGKCHFDADGWLQGPISITHLMTPNHGTGFAQHGRGVVFHTEDGFEAGTVATFMNKANQVSSFFSVSSAGSCHQFLPVGQGYVAWSQAAGNEAWRGIEDEDGTHPSVPMTAAQLATFAQILEACAGFDGFPLQITDDPVNGTGLITHGDGGTAWGGHFGCPGDVRKAQRPAIITLARQIRSGGTNVTVTADGKQSLHQIAAAAGIQAAHMLRITAITDGSFPPDVADYVNAVFAGTTPPSAPVPAGCKFWAPPAA